MIGSFRQGWAAGGVPSLGWVIDFLAVGTDAVLGVFALMFLGLWFRFRLRAVVAGAGVVLAYGISEVVKLLVAGERPCRTAPALVECPAPGDWSFPSNHSAIAGASAMAVFALHRGLGWVAFVVAMAAASSRVVLGVHYVHDVVAGLLLGAVVSWAIARVVRPRARSRADAPTVVLDRVR